MAKVRQENFGGVFFRREDGGWGNVDFHFQEGITDGVDTIVKERIVSFPIADLPASVKTPLQQAWNALLTWRDSQFPV